MIVIQKERSAIHTQVFFLKSVEEANQFYFSFICCLLDHEYNGIYLITTSCTNEKTKNENCISMRTIKRVR